VLRHVSRQVFRPVPNVDSVLLGLVRRGGQRATPAVRRLVHDAFRHRRKALARSLDIARPGIRERVRVQLAEMGLAADVRAERLTPEQFRELAARLER
jgi:16S rRNA (adenine1518-N6/adenine1519-N6)-dimethyltransferase